MKKKIIIIAFISTILSVLIYFYTRNDEITITALGDGLSLGMTPYDIEGYSFNDYLKEDYANNHKLKKYISEFANANKTVKELIYEIKENKTLTIKNEDITIKQAINEANILTIAIGEDELANKKLNSNTKTEFINDIEELFSIIKILNQNQVIIIGLYPKNKNELLYIAKINAVIRDIALTNNFIFIDISNISNHEEYFLTKTSYYINYEGHKAIYDSIKSNLFSQ